MSLTLPAKIIAVQKLILSRVRDRKMPYLQSPRLKRDCFQLDLALPNVFCWIDYPLHAAYVVRKNYCGIKAIWSRVRGEITTAPIMASMQISIIVNIVRSNGCSNICVCVDNKNYCNAKGRDLIQNERRNYGCIHNDIDAIQRYQKNCAQ